MFIAVLYPTLKQQSEINAIFGAARYAYNCGVDAVESYYRKADAGSKFPHQEACKKFDYFLGSYLSLLGSDYLPSGCYDLDYNNLKYRFDISESVNDMTERIYKTDIAADKACSSCDFLRETEEAKKELAGIITSSDEDLYLKYPIIFSNKSAPCKTCKFNLSASRCNPLAWKKIHLENSNDQLFFPYFKRGIKRALKTFEARNKKGLYCDFKKLHRTKKDKKQSFLFEVIPSENDMRHGQYQTIASVVSKDRSSLEIPFICKGAIKCRLFNPSKIKDGDICKVSLSAINGKVFISIFCKSSLQKYEKLARRKKKTRLISQLTKAAGLSFDNVEQGIVNKRAVNRASSSLSSKKRYFQPSKPHQKTSCKVDIKRFKDDFASSTGDKMLVLGENQALGDLFCNLITASNIEAMPLILRE